MLFSSLPTFARKGDRRVIHKGIDSNIITIYSGGGSEIVINKVASYRTSDFDFNIRLIRQIVSESKRFWPNGFCQNGFGQNVLDPNASGPHVLTKTFMAKSICFP